MGQYMAYNYVYQYKDHLGNIRMNYAKDPRSGRIEIVDEHHYYPFGLKHTNYNVDEKDFIKEVEILELKVPPMKVAPYNYKFQSQEWQDELGLNWDSFKWRNYDYAIGRFFNIDPLAEKYSYQSPYNFSENRVVDCRELEGLEAVKSTHGNIINVTIRVKPVNSTNAYPLSQSQINTAMANFSSQTIRSFSGQTAEKQQVNVNVVVDPEATLTVEFKDFVDNPSITPDDFEGQVLNAGAFEYTTGDSQTGTIQVSSKNTFPNSDDTPTSDKRGPGHAASHGFGHAVGLGHDDADAQKDGNLMKDGSANNERTITEKQRSTMINNIPEEEKK